MAEGHAMTPHTIWWCYLIHAKKPGLLRLQHCVQISTHMKKENNNGIIMKIASSLQTLPQKNLGRHLGACRLHSVNLWFRSLKFLPNRPPYLQQSTQIIFISKCCQMHLSKEQVQISIPPAPIKIL